MIKSKKLVMGILAHVDTGKTTLSESILYNSGVIKKLGRVDYKDTYLDTNQMEKERGITIYSKDARFLLGDTEVVLIDTPGHVDFSTEMERVLSVLDVAVLLVSGTSGVQSHTRTLFSLLKSYRVPTFIFVNKMDMPGADAGRVMDEIRTKLSDNAVRFANDFDENIYENIATCRDNMLDEYLETGMISDEEITDTIRDRELFPVYFGSALKNEGVEEFLAGLKRFLPMQGYDSDAEVSAYVYKISRDEMGKRLSHIKILSGMIRVKGMLGEEKINEIRAYSGNRYESVSEACAGDICQVVGLAKSQNGMFYGRADRFTAPVIAPALSYAVHYPEDYDKTQMLSILRELEEEDPALNVEYREQTREIFVSLMGDVQTEVLTRTLQDRYGIDVSFTDGRVCYKETVSHCVEGVGHFEPLRHYAEAHIRIEPLERGQGIVCECDISEDLLARNWQRLIYTHLTEREHRGVLAGAPITDVKLSLVSGRAHLKHTEGGDFRQATYRAIRQGLMELKNVGECHLLEPFYSYTLVIPDEYVGRAMTDITRMSGTSEVAENDHENQLTVLTGRAPVSTMNGYVKEVTAYTRGLGQLSLALSGYDLCHNEEEVLAEATYNPEGDLRNPSSSVFCSHGAGTVIPWDEVPDYMHISYASKDGALGSDSDGTIEDMSLNMALIESQEANKERRRREMQSDIAISVTEVDDILRLSTHANVKGRQGSYKGISAASRERRKDTSDGKVSVYKGMTKKPEYLLVDGYNVIHAWDELNDIAKGNLDGAAGSLNDILCNYQAINDIPVMVVYDAYKVKSHKTEEINYKNITVVYTRTAQTADQYIEQYAHENSKKFDITVVTSDGLEQVIVMGNGGKIMSSREFHEEATRCFKEFNERFNVQ